MDNIIKTALESDIILRNSIAECYTRESYKSDNQWVLDSLHNALKHYKNREVLDTVSTPLKSSSLIVINGIALIYHVAHHSAYVTVERSIKEARETMTLMLREGG